MTSVGLGMVIGVMRKLGIFQCHGFLSIDGKIQYDSALYATLFLDSSVGNRLREYRLEKTGAREGSEFGTDKRR